MENDELKEREKQEVKKAKRKDGSGWIVGVVLIAVGILFLISNFTSINFTNWWALFILIPAAGSFGNALRIYREKSHLNKDARGSLVGGLFLSLIAAIFIFDLDWGKIWPMFIILAGIGALFSAMFDD